MIDEKGKLFGFINIIDLVVILLILAVGGAWYYRHQEPVQVATHTATVYMECPNLLPEIADQIKTGDKLMARGQLQPVVVKSVRMEAAKDSDTGPDGQLVIQKHPFRKDVYLTVEGPISYTGAEIYMAGQAIRAGIDKYKFKTQLVEVDAQILKIEVH